MGVSPYFHEVPFGCVQANQGRMESLEEKPVIERLINAGVYVLSPEAIADIPRATFFPITELFEEAMAKNMNCGTYLIHDDWIDIGHPTQLAQARGMVQT
jgi:NDP-sugar pyrophosphorylase family protein